MLWGEVADNALRDNGIGGMRQPWPPSSAVSG